MTNPTSNSWQLTANSFSDALKYLEQLWIFGIKEGLERTQELAAALGQPQNFYRTIHVTGTNGKGSVCAMLAEILKAQGLRVGLFTSPHLESYCERIKINGKNISEEDFAEMIFRVKDCNVAATHFETLTVAAFLYFKLRAVDVAVVEVGLGGTFDSTNIITPELSVITTVALDHENVLGDLKNIALNKAGIIRPNVPTVTGATGEPLEIIRRVAAEKNSQLYEVSSPADIELNLRGEYQKFNAAIAIKAAQVLGIDDEKIFPALKHVHWPGRFEVIKNSSGVVVIDGAHNPHGAAALRESFWLFGVLKDKNFDEMIKILFRADDFVIVTEVPSERTSKPETICEILRGRGVECVVVENNLAAVERLKNSVAEIKIVAGSLYLIGDVRKLVIRD